MWLIISFNIPRYTRTGRQQYIQFCKSLEKECCQKIHNYLFIRHCSTSYRTTTYIKRIELIIPSKCQIMITTVSDSTFADTRIIFNYPENKKNTTFSQNPPPTIEFF